MVTVFCSLVIWVGVSITGGDSGAVASPRWIRFCSFFGGFWGSILDIRDWLGLGLGRGRGRGRRDCASETESERGEVSGNKDSYQIKRTVVI